MNAAAKFSNRLSVQPGCRGAQSPESLTADGLKSGAVESRQPAQKHDVTPDALSVAAPVSASRYS